MPNAWEQPESIAAEALVQLESSLVITNVAATDKTADFLQRPNGYAIGDTLKIKTRPDYEVTEFSTTVTKQSIRESVRQMTIDKHFDVTVELTAKERALDLDSFSEQVLRPAIYRLAEKCDKYVGEKGLEGAGAYYSDALFQTQADMAQARKAATLQELDPERVCLVDLDLEATLLSANYFSTYQQRGNAGATAFNAGSMGNAMGMDFVPSINFPEQSHTAGTATAVTNNGTGGTEFNQIGMTTLTFDAGSAAPLQLGDRLMIAGVRRPLIVGFPVADASGATGVLLADPITEIIPDNAAITVVGSGQTGAARGMIMDTAAIGFAMPMLDPAPDKPSSVLTSNGYSLRVVSGYDMDEKKYLMSIDCLMGARAWDPRRITVLREY